MELHKIHQKKEELAAKQKAAADYYKSFNKDGEYVMSKEEIEKGQELNKELKSLADFVNEQEMISATASELEEATKSGFINPSKGGFPSKDEKKSLYDRVKESNEFKTYNPNSQQGRASLTVEGMSIRDAMKTAMTTAAGFANPNDRTNIVVGYAEIPILFQSLIPQIDVDVDIVKYMEKTTSTKNAAFKAENVALGESAIAYTERSVTVENIGAFLPITEQQLQVPELTEQLINNDLMYDLMYNEQAALLTGDGNTPNILGVYNKSSINTYAKGTVVGESTPDACLQILKMIRHTGQANPTGFVMHPNDWIQIRLLRNNAGDYIWGSPADVGADRLWGLPVVQSTAATENTILAGDFIRYALIARRKQALVEWGWNASDFSTYRKTARVTTRMAAVWKRATAFGTVTSV